MSRYKNRAQRPRCKSIKNTDCILHFDWAPYETIIKQLKSGVYMLKYRVISPFYTYI